MTHSRALYQRPIAVVLTALYLCATLQFVRYYSKATIFYLNMEAYLAGHERLPFQERILPILLIKPLMHSQWIVKHLVHTNGVYTADRGPFYVISLLAILVAGIFVQKLYMVVSERQTLKFLVYPLFLFAIMWSYSIHNEADFSYPYDLLSVAFFTVGLYVIYMRRFWPLALILLIGTMNRETTLFLIGIYVLDAASRPFAKTEDSLTERLSLNSVPWLRVALLVCIWLTIKVTLARHFADNDSSENYVRIAENFGRLKPRLWPALLNICGYMLPVVFLMRRYLQPTRFANYLFILPFWFAAMFYTGVIVETRIYGELCSFTAVALTVIIERYLEQQASRSSLDPAGTTVDQTNWIGQHENVA